MIEPNYTKKPTLPKIALDGRVLVFGSGKLIHEDVFFDFSSASEIHCFDPLYELNSERPAGRDGKWSFFPDLEVAINGGCFDHVVALFSLHYEPPWIQTLTRLLAALKTERGMFYFAEDCGFRAVLDGATADPAIHTSASHIHEVFKKRHRMGGTDGKSSPWLPDIRASDYRSLATILNVYGLNKNSEPISGDFMRQPGGDLQVEAKPYLPWKSGVDMLERTSLGSAVLETVRVHQFRRSTVIELPETFLSESPVAEVVRSLVFKRTTDALGQLELILSTSADTNEEDQGVYSQLNSFGCAWLSIFYQHIARHVPEIEAIQLIFQRVGDHEEMAEALSAYEFEKGDPFLACSKNSSHLEPWDYQHTERYSNYLEGLTEELGYLAKPIFETGTVGVYWDGVQAKMVEGATADDLTSQFSSRKVPSPCLYVPARLAHVEGKGMEKQRPLTLIAMIVYFREEASLGDLAWRNLHSLLLPLLDNVSARVALGEMLAGHQHKRLLKERERSHKLLLKLQGPLDELTRAFDSVQAGAHEMQAILNSPEESLFRAHKLVADIFIDQKGIKVSDTIIARPAHVPRELADPDLQMLYVLVLCSIFGRRADLRTANSPSAVLGYGRDVLRDAERSPVFDDLCTLVRLVTEATKNRASIGETIDALPDEDVQRRIERQQRVLIRLKMLLFEPFKDFSSTYWPKAPFFVAVEDQQAKLESLQAPPDSTDLATRLAVKHEFSPFPQHGILDFILAAKGEFENRERRNIFASADLSENTDLRAVLKIAYEGGELFVPSKASNHFSFLCHAADHGVSGSNFGNFLASYARLLRHAHSLNSGLVSPTSADWRLSNPQNPCISLAIERCDKQRFFWIEHSHNHGKGTLSLVWSEYGWKNEKCQSGASETSATDEALNTTPQPAATPARIRKKPVSSGNSSKSILLPQREVICFVSDHKKDGPWAAVLNKVGQIEGRRGIVKFVGDSIGSDRPADVVVPEGVHLLILHTRDIDAWLKELKSRYAIVRVSTDPHSLKLPDNAPQWVKKLEHVFPHYFELPENDPNRMGANSALLGAVFDALDSKATP